MRGLGFWKASWEKLLHKNNKNARVLSTFHYIKITLTLMENTYGYSIIPKFAIVSVEK